MDQDSEQQRAITAAGDVELIAGAGTGKTHTLVERCARLMLQHGLPPERIVVVTFTNQAAREVRSRLRQRIAAAQPMPDLEPMIIGTIHSLCAAIVRAHPGESGIDPGFRILDERAAAQRRRQMADALLAEAAAEAAADLHAERPNLFAVCEPPIIRTLIDDILARAGDVDDALRCTTDPTTALARFMRAEMDGLGAFHALFEAGPSHWRGGGETFAQRISACEQHWRDAELALGQARLADALAALRQARARIKGQFGPRNLSDVVATLRTAFDETIGEWLTADVSDADQPVDAARAAAAQTAVMRLARQALERWDTALRADQALDFDGLERHAARLLRDHASVRSAWHARIDAILVDEYQDTNARQHAIIEALTAPGSRFRVGDPRQAIYGFRGADPGIFDALHGAQRLQLTTNRRTHAALLEAIQHICPDDSPRPLLTASRTNPDVPFVGPPVAFIAHPAGTPAAVLVAEALAAQLWQLVERGTIRCDANGICWHDVALLAHTAAHLRVYEATFERAGIPFVTHAGDGLYDRPEVRELLALLRALALPADDHALAGWFYATVFGLSEATRYHLRHDSDGTRRPWRDGCRALPASLDDEQRRRVVRAWQCFEQHRARVDHLPLASFVDDLIADLDLRAVFVGDRVAGERRQRNLDHVVAAIRQGGWLRLHDYLDDRANAATLAVREPEATNTSSRAVQLMTAHGAKGLEFPVVVLADAAHSRSSRTPHLLTDAAFGMALDRPALATPLVDVLAARWRRRDRAESWRLCYVALTRARELVIICGHRPATHAWFDRLMQRAEQHAVPFAVIVPEPPGEPAWPAPAPVVAPPWPDALPLLPDADAAQTVAPDVHEPVPWLPDPTHVADPPAVPPAVLGELVHLALAHGADPRMPALLDDLARQSLWDEALIRAAVDRALELVARWRRHPASAEIDRADQCWRELWLTDEGQSMRIDLLYRHGDRWHIVDFKSDDIADELTLRDRIARYRPQLVRYAAAVRAILGVSPTASLCLLNDRGTVHIVPIPLGGMA